MIHKMEILGKAMLERSLPRPILYLMVILITVTATITNLVGISLATGRLVVKLAREELRELM